MIHSIAPTELIYKYNISSGVYTPACDIPLLRSLFLSDTNIKNTKHQLTPNTIPQFNVIST